MHNYNRQYIDISGLAQELGEETYNAQPGVHAFSGWDFTASFYWKGKQKVYEIVHGKKRRRYLKAFGQHGDTASVPIGIGDSFEEVMCDQRRVDNDKKINI